MELGTDQMVCNKRIFELGFRAELEEKWAKNVGSVAIDLGIYGEKAR